jgi:hypothetical protein
MDKQAALKTPRLQSQQLRLGTLVLRAFMFVGRHIRLVRRSSLHPVPGRVVIDVEIQRDFAHRTIATGQPLDQR